MKAVVLAVRVWNFIFAIGLKRRPPNDFPQSEMGRIRLSDATVRAVHWRCPQCKAHGCGATRSKDGLFGLCDLHQAAIRLSELVEVRDKCCDLASCPDEELEIYCRRFRRLAMHRAAAAKWN